MSTDSQEARRLRIGNAPSSHEWERWAAGLWRCPWCDGFAASAAKPGAEAIATTIEEAEKALVLQATDLLK